MAVAHSLAFLTGATAVGFLPALPPASVSLLLLLTGVAALYWRPVRIPALLLLGFAYTMVIAADRLEPQLEPSLEQADIVIVGRIVGLPDRDAGRARFRMRVEAARHDGQPVELPRTVRLSWYGAEAEEIRPGQRWRFNTRLRTPHGLHNPGGFDYPRWLYYEGIGATGSVRTEPPPWLIDGGTAMLHPLRDHLRSGIRGTEGLDHAGILAALSVGDRSGIDEAAWEVLLITGTNHLIAISGLHVGLAALCGFLVGRIIWRCCPPCRRFPRPVFTAVSGLVLAALYAALAGFAIPTQRALIMLSAGLGMVILRRRARPGEILGTALLAVLLIDPLATLAAGFWLSFAAVAAILLIVCARIAPVGRVEGWIRLQFGIALALLPILVLLFMRTSVSGPVANLVAVPWVSFLVVPPALAGTMLVPLWQEGGEFLLGLADLSLRPLWSFLSWLAALPGAELNRAPAGVAALLLAMGGSVLLLLPRGLPGRAAGAICLLPLLFMAADRPGPGALWLEVLDVGHGTAVIAQTENHVLLYGTGPRLGPSLDAGSAAVVPYLRHAGIHRLDRLVIPHEGNRQAGGLDAIRAAVRVDQVIGGGGYRDQGAAEPCRAGMDWVRDGVRFRVLQPRLGDERLTGEDASCVLRIDAPGGSVLLPGDPGARGIWTLLTRHLPLEADILVAPRQGSAQASIREFADAVDPDWLVLPVARHHPSGNPAPEVAEHYAEARILRTDCTGAVRFVIDREGVTQPPRRWRVDRPRFWRVPCPGESTP